jgi:hypothetical protein
MSESLQCIEDLFGLIFCAKNIPSFINRITNYSAGKITNFIQYTKIDMSTIFELFFIRFSRDKQDYDDSTIYKELENKIVRLIEDLKLLQKYYTDNEYLYLQYKHGQSLIYQHDGSDNHPIKHEEVLKGFQVFPFDNVEISKALKLQRTKLGISLLFSDYTQKHLHELDKQNNLLRFIVSLDDLNINRIYRTTKICTNILEAFRNNILDYCQIPEHHPIITYFPSDEYEGFSTFTEKS